MKLIRPSIAEAGARRCVCVLVVCFFAVLFWFGTVPASQQAPAASYEIPPLKIPQPQFFCGSCHVLTHPEIIQRNYELWKKDKHNKGRAKCQTCHELPKKPIQTSGEKPITHETLQKAGVACASCHMDVIQGAGPSEYEAYFEGDTLKTALVLGTGTVKRGCWRHRSPCTRHAPIALVVT